MQIYESIKKKFKSLRFNSISDGLDELVREAEDNEISYLQFAENLVQHELKQRDMKRIQTNTRRANFPFLKTIEEFDFKFQTTISKKQVTRLLDFVFVENRENIIFIGPPGIGKTHLAVALGLKILDAGYSVQFSTAQSLIETLDLAEATGLLKRKLNALVKFDVLIIDELGYLPLNRKSVFNFFQLINRLYEFRTVILTTNKEFTAWGDFFFEDHVAIPLVDRIIHHSHIFMLGGESYRLREKMNK